MDLSSFIRFIKLCAGRIGQLLNITNLADDCGIGATPAKTWLSILETSFIIYFLRPDYRNFTKRIVKTPKLYFIDTGLACSLLEINQQEQLQTHYLRGSLFENMVINRFYKNALNKGQTPSLSFWRDKKGTEIDLLETSPSTNGENLTAYEIKSGKTFSPDYFKNLKVWSKWSSINHENCMVIYTGQQKLITQDGLLCPWSQMPLG